MESGNGESPHAILDPFTRHEATNLLGGAAHVQPYNRVGKISADLSRAELNAGLPPGARSHAKGHGRSFELELAFTGLFTRDPHVCMRAVRSLALSRSPSPS
jgi:hypothetical protein